MLPVGLLRPCLLPELGSLKSSIPEIGNDGCACTLSLKATWVGCVRAGRKQVKAKPLLKTCRRQSGEHLARGAPRAKRKRDFESKATGPTGASAHV
jgi:hypothetical protein